MMTRAPFFRVKCVESSINVQRCTENFVYFYPELDELQKLSIRFQR